MPGWRCWPVIAWLTFNLKRLRARLPADAGAINVKKVRPALDIDALVHQLTGNGSRPLVVVLTRVADQPAALICDEPMR